MGDSLGGVGWLLGGLWLRPRYGWTGYRKRRALVGANCAQHLIILSSEARAGQPLLAAVAGTGDIGAGFADTAPQEAGAVIGVARAGAAIGVFLQVALLITAAGDGANPQAIRQLCEGGEIGGRFHGSSPDGSCVRGKHYL